MLAGASMGAHTLLNLALRHPDRVAGVVVITPAYSGDPIAEEAAPRALGPTIRRIAHRRGRGVCRGDGPSCREHSRVRRHGFEGDAAAALTARPPRRAGRRAERAAAVAAVREPARTSAPSPCLRWSSPPTTTPIPSTRRRSGSRMPQALPNARLITDASGKISGRLAGKPALADHRRRRHEIQAWAEPASRPAQPDCRACQPHLTVTAVVLVLDGAA